MDEILNENKLLTFKEFNEKLKELDKINVEIIEALEDILLKINNSNT